LTFFSYSQNFEDVILWRALKTVRDGFYIDVGAGNPELHSVTKAFYDLGWRGINVEPDPRAFAKLSEARPNDINIRACIAEQRGRVNFFCISESGLSTTVDDVAEFHRREGYNVETIELPSIPLRDICQTHVRTEIHFLKIDVEGGERSVLRSMDFHKWRPWILVVEATEPNSPTQTFKLWEDILQKANYDFVYFDGLNRFYIAAERQELKQFFNVPPNVFDGFTLNSSRDAWLRAEESERRAAEGRNRIKRLISAFDNERKTADGEIHRLRKELVHIKQSLLELIWSREDLLALVFSSTSWRITWPLRRVRHKLDSIFGRARQHSLPRAPALPTVRSDIPGTHDPTVDALPRGTIFMECTHTYYSDLNTGIQRVVRNIVRNATAIAENLGMNVVPVIEEDGCYRIVGTARILRDKRAQDPIAPADESQNYKLGLSPDIGMIVTNLDQIVNHSGNVLLLLDSSWTIPIWEPTDRFQAAGGKVVGVIYDLIPITHAHTSVHELTVLFEKWFMRHMSTSDGFIAISASVRNQIKDFAWEHGRLEWANPRAALGYFHLGGELDFATTQTAPSARITEIFASRLPTFLMVGSIEPRKMHRYVLEAFNRLWDAGDQVRLVILGRQAWKTEEFLEQVARHPRSGTDLFLLRDASDDELELCYKKADALIIASEIEGFGLPIVEAFERGLPVLCSDIPVFREIAWRKARFFKLDDPDYLLVAVRAFCERRQKGTITRRQIKGLTWRESTAELFSALDKIVPLKAGP